MTIAPFEGSRIKIERAKAHLDELTREIDSFLARGAVKVVCERAHEYDGLPGVTLAFTYREKEPVPLSWSAILGDIVHNLHSALDLAVSDAHRITGGKPKDADYVHYPFCKEATYLPDMIRSRRLSGIGRPFLDIIRQTAPYKGGNDGLRAVHDLDGMDKHRALVPFVSVVSMPWPVPVVEGSRDFGTQIVKNGQRLIIFPASVVPAPLGTEIKAKFSIVFAANGPFEGRELVPQLAACVASIEVIVGLFQAEASKYPPLSGIGSP